MAKRRRSKKPNLPKATLDRARRQVGQEIPEDEAKVEAVEAQSLEADATPDEVEEEKQPVRAAAASQSVADRQRKRAAIQLEKARKKGELDAEMMREMLANPVRVVTDEEMAEDYRHVLVDLRNMGILAAALMILLVGLAQFL